MEFVFRAYVIYRTCFVADEDTLLLDSSEVRGGGDPLARRIPLCNGHFWDLIYKMDWFLEFWISTISTIFALYFQNYFLICLFVSFESISSK